MKKSILFLMLLTLSLFAFGCKKKEEPSSSGPGKVITTAAYKKHFGAAPPLDKNTAYAFVIYFPSAKETGKVVPFPFFSFDRESLKKVATDRLLVGMAVGSYAGELQQLPSGTRLVSLTDEKGTVTATFSKEFEAAKPAAAAAVVLTLKQFEGVSDVRLQIEGKEKPLAVSAKEDAILEPSAPRLLAVTAMRDKGEKDVDEVDAFFDRPVDVKELSLLSEKGEQFPGEIYHSAFDMSAVLKPKDPSLFQEGVPVKVRWKVVDKLGRAAEGESVWPLVIKEH